MLEDHLNDHVPFPQPLLRAIHTYTGKMLQKIMNPIPPPPPQKKNASIKECAGKGQVQFARKKIFYKKILNTYDRIRITLLIGKK